jgi:DNA helicase II / ATP-dependent DNA helicase PcrA
LQGGESSQAFRMVEREVALLAFGEQAITRQKLASLNLQRTKWKQTVYGILTLAASSTATSWNEWVSELRSKLERDIVQLTGADEKLGALLKKDSPDVIRSVAAPATMHLRWPTNYQFLNIHKAKGREFDAVVLFQPKPHASYDPCPSSEWFASGSEERRIAYVAASRAKRVLILCMHSKTYEALKTQQPHFLELFDVKLLGA